MFTENCPLYKQLVEVIQVLSTPPASRSKHSYEGVPSRQIFWLVLTETKQYAQQKCSVSTLEDPISPPCLPTANLISWKHLIKEAAYLPLRDFPESWKQEAPAPTPAIPEVTPNLSAHATIQGLPWNGLTLPPLGANPFLQQSVMSTPQKVPERVTAAYSKALKANPGSRMTQILSAGGKPMHSFPKTKNGQSVCFNYITNTCRFGSTCSFAHSDVDKLPKGFLSAWEDTMEKGAEKIVKEAEDRKRKRE